MSGEYQLSEGHPSLSILSDVDEDVYNIGNVNDLKSLLERKKSG